MLIRVPKICIRMFIILNEKFTRPDTFLEYLGKLPNAENKRELKEKFLEALVLENKAEDEKCHPILAIMADDDVSKKMESDWPKI